MLAQLHLLQQFHHVKSQQQETEVTGWQGTFAMLLSITPNSAFFLSSHSLVEIL